MSNITLTVASSGSIAVVDSQKISLSIQTIDNVVFSQAGSDLVISITTGGETIRLENFFTIAAGDLPPLLALADGSVLSAAEVTDLVENFDAAAISPAAGGGAGGATGGGANFEGFGLESIGEGLETGDLLGATELEFDVASEIETVVEAEAGSCEGQFFEGEQFAYKDERNYGQYDDTFVGTDCDDTFVGNYGNDNMTGGDGADTFIYAGDYCCYYQPDGDDTITDFDISEGDVIDLDALFDNMGIATENRADMVNVSNSNVLTVDGTYSFSITIQGDTIADFDNASDLLATGIDVGDQPDVS